GRAANRACRVLADADRAEIGRDGDAAAAGRPTCVARRVVGVVAVAEGRAGAAGRELAKIGLGENDRTLGQHLFDDRGVARRNEGLEQSRSVSGRHEVGLDLVLHQNRDAVQPADRATALSLVSSSPAIVTAAGLTFWIALSFGPA